MTLRSALVSDLLRDEVPGSEFPAPQSVPPVDAIVPDPESPGGSVR